MFRVIPEPIRAAAGLAATVLDEARKLPRTLPALPVRVIGLAMQTALKLQQHWSGLVARGDEVFTGLRGANEPGLATFDEDVETPVAPEASARASAFDRAAADVPDEIVDDEISGLPADPAPEEVVEALQDITDQVAALDESTGTEAVLTAEDALESALLETDGDRADGGAADADTGTDAAVGGDVSTAVDVLTPDGGIATVDATVTDEGVAAPEAGEDAGGAAQGEELPADLPPSNATLADPVAVPQAPGLEGAPAKAGAGEGTAGEDTAEATAVDEGGTPVAAATGVRTDVGGSDTAEEDAAIAEGAAVGAVGGDSAAPTDDPQGGSELSGSQAAGTAPIQGYDGFTVAQLRGRLRGYQLATVQDLLAYEESTRNREPFIRMLRNRLEKLEQQAAESSPLAPRGM